MSRILIVEDTPEIAESLQQSLEEEGHDAALATRAAHALALAASHRPELVVLDLGLPDRDGLDVLDELRRRGSDVPVLILTARAQEADKLEGFRRGADDYVTKPFSVAELQARIAALLRRARGGASAPAPAAPSPAPLTDAALTGRYALTPREIEVARLIGDGLTNAEIADRLGIRFPTARTHAEHVLAKLQVRSRAAVGALLYGGSGIAG